MDEEWEEINGEDFQKLKEEAFDISWVYLPQHQRVLTKKFLQYQHQIRNLKAFDSDVWIATFPRSGTRWMQELVWCLRHGIGKENGKSLEERIPYFEMDVVFSGYPKTSTMDLVESLDQPRTIKTHMSYDMLPQEVKEKAKIICVIRNPHDVCASLFNLWKLTREYTGDLATVVKVFTRDECIFAPYSTHVLSYWNERKKNSNLLIVFYEEMQTDLPSVVRKVASFINAEISEEDVTKLCNHLHVDNMRKNPLVNLDQFKEIQAKLNYTGTFINKGKTGNWKETLDQSMIDQLKKWEEKWLKDTDLRFVYEI